MTAEPNGQPDELGNRQPASQNVYSGNAQVVVQARTIVGHLVFPGSGVNAWPVVTGYALAFALFGTTGLLGWQALDRLGSQRQPVITWLLAGGALLCLAGAVLQLRRARRRWRGYRALDEEYRLNSAAALLAATTEAAWEREEQARLLYDPAPLPVRWHRVDPSLREPPPGPRTGLREPHGSFERIRDAFEAAPSRRLVVLGGPGAGKSVLAARFVLAHLAHRRNENPGAPVAVLLPLASWNPATPFEEWVAARIVQACPRLADLGDPDTAVKLYRTGRLLPVLDGLDELPAAARPRLIEALNERQGGRTGPVVLTSRREEYRKAVAGGGASLRPAEVVELAPLAAEDLREFLPRTVDPARRNGDDGSSWREVLNAPGARGALLGEVLSTPLMVALARAAYSETGASPSELLREDAFPDRDAVEHHLLDQFVAAVYRRGPGPDPATGKPGPEWTAAHARAWLTTLAQRLQRLGLREITWWRLTPGVPEAARAALEVLALVLTLGVTGWLVLGQPPRPQQPPPPYVLGVQATACLAALLTRPFGTPDSGIAPRRVAVRGRWRAFFGQGAIAAAVVLPIGLPLHIPPAVLAALLLLFAARAFVDHAVDVTEAGSPWQLLRSDRTSVLLLAPVHALRGEGPAAVRSWLLAWTALGPLLVVTAWNRTGGHAAVGPLIWTVAAAGSLVALALLGLAASAWWAFTTTRIALATTGRLPWALGAFLEDAHDRGVLRQAGGVYEFRHARLQERLAGGPAPEPAPPRRLPLPPLPVNLSAVPAALLILLGASLTPGAPGPYEGEELGCPLLQVPKGYRQTKNEYADKDRYSCTWEGETDAASAPLLDASSWFPVPDNSYVGSYFLNVFVEVARPRTSRSAVEVASEMFDLLREEWGAERDVRGLGQEAAVSGPGTPSYALIRVENVVVVAQVGDHRPICRSTTDTVALAQAAAALRGLGISDDRPPADASSTPWCEASAEEPNEQNPPPPDPTPSPAPSPTPTESPDTSPVPTELRIDTDGGRRTHHCRGGAVEIYADDVALTLTGSCDGLYVYGHENSVWVQHAGTVQVTGRLNTVWCQEPASDVYDLSGIAYGEPRSGMLLGCRR
ncbi:NACHT domain-containing protein [Streptomyces sp. NPDC086081]|uniref:NACHT domain-containing protein n=1 Tax=Streptomyces sp. NPDC086081 TaxID=3365749 RepID=UPI00382C0F46